MRIPSAQELRHAHGMFEDNEPRAFVYNTAQREASASLANAALILLLIWNRDPYIKLTGATFLSFLKKHKQDLRSSIDTIIPVLRPLENESLESIDFSKQSDIIKKSFITLGQIEKIGATAAGKILHLIMPKLFVMWDEAIRDAYRLSEIESQQGLSKTEYMEYYAEAYIRFLQEMQAIAIRLAENGEKDVLLARCGNVTMPKLIDEYNYCKFTLRLKAIKP